MREYTFKSHPATLLDLHCQEALARQASHSPKSPSLAAVKHFKQVRTKIDLDFLALLGRYLMYMYLDFPDYFRRNTPRLMIKECGYIQ